MSTYGAWYGARSTSEHLIDSNRHITVLPQLETVQAYENLDELFEVPGVGAFIIGPSDLSQSMGYPGEIDHPRVQEVVVDVIRRCRKAGVAVGTVAATPERVDELRELGAQILLTGVSSLLLGAGRSFVDRARALMES